MNLNFTTPQGIDYEMKFRKPDRRSFQGCDGVCYYPRNGEGKIYINPYRTNQTIEEE